MKNLKELSLKEKIEISGGSEFSDAFWYGIGWIGAKIEKCITAIGSYYQNQNGITTKKY